ncbi:MAG: Cys-Gln thioester bond-forming surface protein [Bacilli bacterium]|nr:Cys-Gln thioester bond-forming surface protein [Bacilli bacterium]MBQ9853945.1 Cys-Gln thioester bond-forming surface protein [Bacilli bacterium]
MKDKQKLIPKIIFGVFTLLVMGFTDVHASTLVQTPIDDTYYTRRGGGQSYMSAQYNTYDMDGKTVYCIEPGVDITTHNYIGAEGFINSPYSDEINQKIQLIGYYGFEYPGHNTMRYRMATQALIWETTGGQILEFWTEQYGYGDYINLNKEKNEIMRLVNAHYQKPSFHSEVKTAVINQAVTFTDTSGILSEFEVYRSDNATSVINGNTLSVIPNAVGEITVSLTRKSYKTSTTTIFVGIDGKSQKMGLFGANDPILTIVKLNVYGGTINVEKVDSKTLLPVPRGDGQLKGAVYGVYDESDFRVGQVVIGENSLGKSDYLPKLGRFYLLEEKNSLGYTLDPTKYYFEITANDLNPTIKVYEQIIEKDFELYKVEADGTTAILKAEPNVTFEFYLKSNMELYESATTNSKGHLKVTLPYGTYIVHQATSTPNFEKVEDFEIVINENSEELTTKIISNAEVTAKVKVVKVDSESKKVLVRDGIKFKIKNLDTNEYVCQNITYPTQSTICVFETSDGMFTTPYVLESGNYQIEELEEQTINGYVWNPTPLKFSITENSNFIYDDEFGVMLEVQFENKQVKGEFEITKLGEKMVVENGTFSYEKILLDGVSYDLYADGDIYSQDGTLIYKDKDLIKSFKTINGKYKVTDLYLGNYCLVETSSVMNHVIDVTPYCFSIEYKDQYTDIVSIEFTLKNHLIKSDFELTKTDFSTGEVIAGALIEIYNENEELVFSDYTDEFGKIHVKDLGFGKYKFLEIEAPESYVLNTDAHYFEILENGEIVKDTLTNVKITGDFELTKVDIATGEVIAGALIEIYDENEELVFSDYTDEFGKIYIKGLKYGKYKYFESQAPEGYILNNEPHYFEILEDGTIIKDTLSNEKIIVEVPNTSVADSKVVTAITIVSILAGLGFIIYDKKRKK